MNRRSRRWEFEKNLRPTSLKHSAINAEEHMSYDMMAAARWILTGGPETYKYGNVAFTEGV